MTKVSRRTNRNASPPQSIRRSARKLISHDTKFERLRQQRFLRNVRQSSKFKSKPRHTFRLKIRQIIRKYASKKKLQRQIRFMAYFNLVYSAEKSFLLSKPSERIDCESTMDNDEKSASNKLLKLQDKYATLFGPSTPEKHENKLLSASPHSPINKSAVLNRTISQQSSKSTKSLEDKFATLFGRESPDEFTQQRVPGTPKTTNLSTRAQRGLSHSNQKSKATKPSLRRSDSFPSTFSETTTSKIQISTKEEQPSTSKGKLDSSCLKQVSIMSSTYDDMFNSHSSSPISTKSSKDSFDICCESSNELPNKKSPSRTPPTTHCQTSSSNPIRTKKGPQTPTNLNKSIDSSEQFKPKIGPQTPKTPYASNDSFENYRRTNISYLDSLFSDDSSLLYHSNDSSFGYSSPTTSQRSTPSSSYTNPFSRPNRYDSRTSYNSKNEIRTRNKIGPKTPPSSPRKHSRSSRDSSSSRFRSKIGPRTPTSSRSHISHHSTPRHRKYRKKIGPQTPKTPLRSHRHKVGPRTPKTPKHSPNQSHQHQSSTPNDDYNLQILIKSDRLAGILNKDNDGTILSSTSSSLADVNDHGPFNMVTFHSDVKVFIQKTAQLLYDRGC